MKTTKEMIEVMQAYDRGEKIDFFYRGMEWKDTKNLLHWMMGGVR